MHWPYAGQLLLASETDVVHWLLLLSLVSLRQTIGALVTFAFPGQFKTDNHPLRFASKTHGAAATIAFTVRNK